MLVAGDIPAHKGMKTMKFSVQLNMFMTEFSEFADVILPVSSFLENDGHMLSLNGKPGKLKRVVRGPENIKSISEIISELAGSMDENGFESRKTGDIWKEIMKMNFIKNGGNNTVPEKLIPLRTFQIKRDGPLSKLPYDKHNYYRYRGNNLTELIPDLKKIVNRST